MPERLTREPSPAERIGKPWSVTVLRAIGPSGELLWPEHTNIDQLRGIAAGGMALFQSIYQQDASGLDAAVFRPEWFLEFAKPDQIERQPSATEPGKWITLTAEEMLREGMVQAILPDIRSLTSLQACDLAIKQSETSDFYARVNALVSISGDVYVQDVRQDRLSDTEMVRDIAEAGQKYKCRAIGIESNGFQSLIFKQASRGYNLPFVELDPAGRDKVLRARPIAAQAENGKLYLQYGARWNQPFRYQLISFPGGAHDDSVDALAYLGDMIRTWVGVRPGAFAALQDELRDGRRLDSVPAPWMR